MRKFSGFWLGYLCLVLLTACVQKDEPTGTGPEAISGEVGSAQLRLPAIPPGFLAKRTAGPRDSAGPVDTLDTVRAYFILTITGPGMTPRRLSWPLDTGSRTVVVGNIPTGNRLFTGELALGGDVRYADSAWALIQAGRTATVHLNLRAATGNAEICVEVEGLTGPLCRPDRVPVDVSGCWYFVAGDSLAPDTAHLTITQRDSSVLAVLEIGGRRDSAAGRIMGMRSVSIGTDSAASFLLSLTADSSGNYMSGRFIDRRLPSQPSWFVRALRRQCQVVPPPVDSLTCWSATQYLGRDTSAGRYLMLERGNRIYGLFQWNRSRQMPVTGYASRLNPPIGGGGPLALYLYGAFPPGMDPAHPTWPDSAHYKGQIAADDPLRIAYGSVNRLDTAGNYRNVGSWTAGRGTCTAAERRAVLAAHGL